MVYREVERSTVECLHFDLSSLIGEDKRKLGEMEKLVIHVMSKEKDRDNMITNNYFKKLILAFIEHLLYPSYALPCISLVTAHKVKSVLSLPRMQTWTLKVTMVMQDVSGNAAVETQV